MNQAASAFPASPPAKPLATAFLVAGLTALGPARAALAGTWTVAADPNGPLINQTETLLADGRVLTTGGDAGILASARTDIFDPVTNTWRRVRSMNHRRSQATATLLPDGTVLVAGGTRTTGLPSDVAPGEIYDPAANTWTDVGPMVIPRFDQMAILLNTGDVLLCGGTPDVSNNLSSCELYLKAQRRFVLTGDMFTPRRYSAMVRLPDGDVLTDGDQGGAEVYSLATATWSATPRPPSYNFGPSFAVLDSGTVLEPPNYDYHGTSGVNKSNFYFSTKNVWAAGAPTLGRVYAATVTLADDTVLTTGGCSFTCATQNLNTTSIFDPVTRSWSDGPSMNYGREDHSAVRLNDGRVLVVGGQAPAEIYTP